MQIRSAMLACAKKGEWATEGDGECEATTQNHPLELSYRFSFELTSWAFGMKIWSSIHAASGNATHLFASPFAIQSGTSHQQSERVTFTQSEQTQRNDTQINKEPQQPLSENLVIYTYVAYEIMLVVCVCVRVSVWANVFRILLLNCYSCSLAMLSTAMDKLARAQRHPNWRSCNAYTYTKNGETRINVYTYLYRSNKESEFKYWWCLNWIRHRYLCH